MHIISFPPYSLTLESLHTVATAELQNMSLFLAETDFSHLPASFLHTKTH